jgi:solute carrier family 25 (mitochondrial uncoupling protein), member 8/9
MDSFHTLTMFASAALAGCTTEMITLPFDTVKVRLQQVDAQSFLKKYKTEEKKILFSFFPFNISSKFLESLRQMKRLEGFSSWYRGLTPGLCRQIIFAGSRITLYPHLRDCLINWNENSIIILPNLFNQITAGIFAGAIGITLANPADLIKICMQSNNLLTRNSSSHVKDKFKPKNMQTVLIELYKTNGIKSFWKGYIPNVLRNCIISSVMLLENSVISSIFFFF